MKIFCSPMSGVTDYAYRQILLNEGADLVFTEMVNTKILLRDNELINDNFLKVSDYEKEGVQIFGSDMEELRISFNILADRGFKHLNLNMGCPKPKILKKGAGANLLSRYEEVYNLLSNLKKELGSDKKLSIKIRLSENDENFIQLANDLNLSFICVHGRSKEQAFKGLSDYSKLSYLSKMSNIDFIANGDINSLSDYESKAYNKNFAGIMLARGIIGNPFLISDIKNLKVSHADINKRKKTLLCHMNAMLTTKTKNKVALDINKFILSYFKDFFSKENIIHILKEKDFDKKINLITKLAP